MRRSWLSGSCGESRWQLVLIAGCTVSRPFVGVQAKDRSSTGSVLLLTHYPVV